MKDIENKYISLKKEFISLKKDYVDEGKVWHSKSIYQLDMEQQENEAIIENNDSDTVRIYRGGMGDDISEMAKLCVSLILIASFMVISFMLMSLSKSVINEGQANIAVSLDELNHSIFDELDQTVVTGTYVKSTINLFTGRNYAILVGTKSILNSESNLKYMCSTNNFESDIFKNPDLVNYGSVLNSNVTFNDGKFITEDFAIDENYNIVRNNDVSGTIERGNVEYIKESAIFNSYTIKDSSGQYVGLVFVEK